MDHRPHLMHFSVHLQDTIFYCRHTTSRIGPHGDLAIVGLQIEFINTTRDHGEQKPFRRLCSVCRLFKFYTILQRSRAPEQRTNGLHSDIIPGTGRLVAVELWGAFGTIQDF